MQYPGRVIKAGERDATVIKESTIEGNTDASKSREGGGVYRLSRKIVDINKGFIDYTG